MIGRFSTVALVSYIVFLFTAIAFATVKGTNNRIDFNSDSADAKEMSLTPTGLGIANTSPSTNLDVTGSGIITGNMVIGGSSGTSTLTVHGSMGYSVQSVTAGSNIITDSMVLANATGGNIILRLPYAGNASGAFYTIKKINETYQVYVSGGGNCIDGFSTMYATTGNKDHVTFASDGADWYIMSATGSATTVEIASDNLLIWWELNESSGNTVSDSSSSGIYTGNLINEHYFSGNIITGTRGTAVSLDDVDDKIIREGDPFDLDEYSYAFWFKADNAADDATTGSPEIYGTAGFSYASYDSTWDKTAYHVEDDDDTIRTKLVSSVPANTWHHITVTYDGALLKAYLNGVYESGNTATSWKGAVAGNISLTNPGVFTTNGISYDDMRFFTKALDSEEVQILYYTGNP